MMRTAPPFRADHVGSLLRPPELREARAAHAEGRLSADALRRVEDEAVRQVVRLQEDVGLQGITDGEYRRGSWHMDFLYQIGGVSKSQGRQKARFHNERGDIEFTPTAVEVTGPLTLERTVFGDDFSFLRSVTNRTPKLTMPAPSLLYFRAPRSAIDPKTYADADDFWRDLARVYAEQIAALGRLGCTYLQLDETTLAYLNDPEQRDHMTRLGWDGEQQHLRCVSLINDALAGRPDGMTVCTHFCRGNFRSSWVASGGYDYVAEAVFGGLAVDGFFLEFDDERSGGFEPLRFVPKGKYVVLGLVTSKRPALERKEDLKRRVDEAAKYVPLDQLCLSPQCGFSSTIDGNELTVDEEIAKLRLVVETAQEIWG